MYPYPTPPLQSEEGLRKSNMKKLIGRDSTLWGLTTVISNLAISVVVGILSVALPLLPQTVSLFIDSDMGELLFQIAFSLLVFTIPYIIAARMSKQKVKSLIKIKWKKTRLTAPLILVSLGAAMAINLLVSQFVQLLEGYGIDTAAPELDMPQSLFGAVLYVITLTVIPAVVEEFAFRGIILGSMKKYGTAYAIIASSVLFGLMHGNIVQIPFATALGMVMAYVAVASDSILPCIIIHFLNNLAGAAQTVAQSFGSEQLGNLTVYAFFLVYLVLGLVGFVMLCKRYKDPFANIKEKGALSVTESTKAALFSGGFITAIIYFGGSACLLLLTNSMSSL